MQTPEIISPRGNSNKDWKDYLLLIGGVIILLVGFFMLLEIALGLAFLLLGFYVVNWYLEKHRHKDK